MAKPNHRYFTQFIAIALSLLLGSSALAAEDAPELEDRVKAACLFNFAVNAKWPSHSFADPGEPFVIGFAGDATFRPLLENGLQGKTLNERAIEVRTVRTLEEAEACHLLYISGKTEPEMKSALLESLALKPVLTVGYDKGFAQRGGILNFTKLKGRIRFEVNRKAVDRAGVKLSSQLLKLAILVNDGNRKGKS